MALRKLLKKQLDYREKRRTAYRAKMGRSAFSRPAPGGLEDSIDFSVEAEVGQEARAVVFVSGFAKAKDYAERMNDGPYNLGIGSRNKMARGGVEVGPDFINRAGNENQDEIQRIIERNLNTAIKKARGDT